MSQHLSDAIYHRYRDQIHGLSSTPECIAIFAAFVAEQVIVFLRLDALIEENKKLGAEEKRAALVSNCLSWLALAELEKGPLLSFTAGSPVSQSPVKVHASDLLRRPGLICHDRHNRPRHFSFSFDDPEDKANSYHSDSSRFGHRQASAEEVKSIIEQLKARQIRSSRTPAVEPAGNINEDKTEVKETISSPVLKLKPHSVDKNFDVLHLSGSNAEEAPLKADEFQFLSTEQRVELLDERIAAGESRAAAVESKIERLAGQTAASESKINQLTGQTAANQSEIEKVKQKVEALENQQSLATTVHSEEKRSLHTTSTTLSSSTSSTTSTINLLPSTPRTLPTDQSSSSESKHNALDLEREIMSLKKENEKINDIVKNQANKIMELEKQNEENKAEFNRKVRRLENMIQGLIFVPPPVPMPVPIFAPPPVPIPVPAPVINAPVVLDDQPLDPLDTENNDEADELEQIEPIEALELSRAEAERALPATSSSSSSTTRSSDASNSRRNSETKEIKTDQRAALPVASNSSSSTARIGDALGGLRRNSEAKTPIEPVPLQTAVVNTAPAVPHAPITANTANAIRPRTQLASLYCFPDEDQIEPYTSATILKRRGRRN